LIVFSADVVADDWHRDITQAKIISLAMSRLEARGKGILLLHDIHPKTAAALPGLLDQLKANGFHVVQVVPSAAYEMAMARRPATAMVASAIPGELTTHDDEALPAWPQAVDQPTLDIAVLPVPNPAAFEPDTVSTDDSSEVHWPEVQASIAAIAIPKPAMRRDRHKKYAERGGRKRRTKEPRVHLAHAAELERAERHRHAEHGRGHARSGA
ncbi:MAG: hypothetical protein WBD71_07940, partial [Xanthobacteraceae bacterium]